MTAAAGPDAQRPGHTYDIVDMGEGLIRLTPTEGAIAWRLRGLLDQSVEVIFNLGIDAKQAGTTSSSGS